MNRFKFLLLIAGLGVVFSAKAQEGRLTEEDVNIQKVFIEASREKLLGNYENAAFLYKEVLKMDNSNHAAAYELSRVYDILNKDDKALKSIKTAVLLEKNNVWYKGYLADLYKKLGKDMDAALVYEDLVKDNPSNDYYYFRWAYFLVRANQISKAVKVYDALEKQIGINEEVVRRKHTLYVGSGNNKKAAKELERLIDAFPNDTDYYHLLAGFYEQISENKLAQEVYQQVIKIDPSDVKANLALAAMNKGNNDMTYLNSLKNVFTQSDVNIDVKISELFPYVSKVANTGDKDLATAALELSQILEDVHPDEAKAFSVSGDLLYYSGQKDEALKKYLRTLELNENVFLVWEQVMYIYAETKNYKDLADVSEEVMDLFPNQARAYYFQGLALHHQGDNQDAVNILQQALMMTGKNVQLKFDLLALLGATYHDLKQFGKSDKAFSEALKMNPKSAETLNTYSEALGQRGVELGKAKEMAGRANEIKSNRPEFQNTYGLILYKLKEYDAAKEWFEKALGNGGEEWPNILENYGDVLFKTNEEDRAMEYWQKALQKGSKSDKLEKKIADKKLYE